MISSYTASMIMVWMALGALCVLIREKQRIARKDKRLLYLTYALIALAALAEWCGVAMDGRMDAPRWAMRAAKCADYILTPMAGGALVAQMRLKNRWMSVLLGLLAANTLFQLAAAFNDWMAVIDAQNRYAHGRLYGVYLGLCLVVIALVVVEFIVYSRSFQRQNRLSLYAAMAVVVAGVEMQELLPEEPRTTYIGMALGAALMFIHYSEFYSMTVDDHLRAQQVQIDTDALTGVFSRYAYSQTLNGYAADAPLPGDLVAFTIDINGLKQVNDTLGHEVGDALIIESARCIESVFGVAGRCFRTGGDEFVVLAEMGSDAAVRALGKLKDEADRRQGRLASPLALAAGYARAADHPGLSAEALVREADRAMYAAKAAYYRENGVDRRRR